MQSAKESAEKLSSEAQRKADEATEAAKQTKEEAKRKAEETTKSAEEKAKQLSEEAQRKVRCEPQDQPITMKTVTEAALQLSWQSLSPCTSRMVDSSLKVRLYNFGHRGATTMEQGLRQSQKCKSLCQANASSC